MIDSSLLMIRKRFLPESTRQELFALARDVSAPHGLARRANASVLLGKGMSCAEVAAALLINDDTVRRWHGLYAAGGVAELKRNNYERSECLLSDAQQSELKAWVGKTLPRSSRVVGAFIRIEFEIEYQSRSGLIELLHRLGMEHRRPCSVPRKLDVAKQTAFIAGYADLLNHLADDEVVLFGDAVHPSHQVRPVACWAPKDVKIALEQTVG